MVGGRANQHVELRVFECLAKILDDGRLGTIAGGGRFDCRGNDVRIGLADVAKLDFRKRRELGNECFAAAVHPHDGHAHRLEVSLRLEVCRTRQPHGRDGRGCGGSRAEKCSSI